MKDTATLLQHTFGFLIILIALTGILLRVNRRFPVLHDTPTLLSPNPCTTSYSLGRVQMAFWTGLASSAFVYVIVLWQFKWFGGSGNIAAFDGDFNPNVVALMGISGATGVITAAVDSQKDSMVQTAGSTLRGTVASLVGSGQQIIELLVRISAASREHSVATSVLSQALQPLRTQRAQNVADIGRQGDIMKRNRRTATHATFISDLLVAENGNSQRRLQMTLADDPVHAHVRHLFRRDCRYRRKGRRNDLEPGTRTHRRVEPSLCWLQDSGAVSRQCSGACWRKVGQRCPEFRLKA